MKKNSTPQPNPHFRKSLSFIQIAALNFFVQKHTPHHHTYLILKEGERKNKTKSEYMLPEIEKERKGEREKAREERGREGGKEGLKEGKEKSIKVK